MRLLAFSDLHADTAVLKKLVKRAQKDDIDLVVCAGDFTVFEGRMYYILKKLDKIGKKILIIPGNHEAPESVEEAIKRYENFVFLHKKSWKKDGVRFLGWGTDGFSLESAEFRKVAREWRRSFAGGKEKLVLVTHAPPYGTKLDALNNDHVGNKDIRKGIERLKPVLAISGHIHENEGKEDKIGKTRIVNPGWNGVILEV